MFQTRLPGETALPDGTPEFRLFCDDVYSGAAPGHCGVHVLPVLSTCLSHDIDNCVLLRPLRGKNSVKAQYSSSVEEQLWQEEAGKMVYWVNVSE